MYRILLKNVTNTHEYEELIKVFLRPAEFELTMEDDQASEENFDYVFHGSDDKNILKKEIYETFRKLTGKIPAWGIITGIRPVKLTGEILQSFDGDHAKARTKLLDYYCVSKKKADLALEMYDYQQEVLGAVPRDSVGIYLGIPFCPTRCLYCSFTSNQVSGDEIERYLKALHTEIDFVSREMKQSGVHAESVYIGGGTPTTLTADQLDELLQHIARAFDSEKLREFTVEAGRPDTLTKEKLRAILDSGAERISINPQTMKDETLKLIGRDHDSSQIRNAFRLSKEAGVPVINADVIAGLPEESLVDFQNTLQEVLALEPENITVHTLAIKRASRLAAVDKEYHYKHADTVKQMLEHSEKTLDREGYRSYYLYRQKQMAGALENTGYCRPGTEGIYNVRIMEEHQTIIALGAGGISKIYFPEENRHERVPNVSNYQIYIERLEEMLDRKRKDLFRYLKND